MYTVKKIVLAYSGGLDTSVILPWLKEKYGCPVVAFVADIGQGEAELAGIEKKALASGAQKCIVADLKREFAEEYCFRLLKAGSVYEQVYMLGTSIARPLIAKHQVMIAQQEGADAVAHGCTGKGNDQVRFELTYMALDPRLKVIAPWREWDIKSREDALAYAESHNVPVTATLKSIYSRDRNLWHISHEGGLLEDPWNEPDEEMFVLTNSPEKAPNEPQVIELEFEKGIPVRLDGKAYSPATLIETLNQIGGTHGVGRVDLVENRLVGMKSHGVYETPGGTILLAAHRELESVTLDRETLHYKDMVAQRYAELVYYGQWFTPLRESLDAFFEKTQDFVTGKVRLKLYKGNVISIGRYSRYSLYREDFATFGQDSVYDQSDAEGFITLFGLPLKVQAMREITTGLRTNYEKTDYSKFKRD